MIERYQQQVAQLADELKCRLDVDDKFRVAGMMFVESSYVEVPPITNQIDYLINLHELGHMAFDHTQIRYPHTQHKRFYFDNGVLHSEAQAWEYALDKCIDPLQEASRRFAWDVCLGSYYEHGYIAAKGKPDRLHNGNRHHVEFVWDEPDDYFTSIVRKIQGSTTDFKIGYRGVVSFQ